MWFDKQAGRRPAQAQPDHQLRISGLAVVLGYAPFTNPWEVRMRLITLLTIALTIGGGTARAKVSINVSVVRLFNACLSEAIQNGQTIKNGSAIIFRCSGDTARQFFDFLEVNYNTQTINRRGIFLTRYFREGDNNDNCFQAAQDPSGRALSNTFGCQIFLFVGPLLNR